MATEDLTGADKFIDDLVATNPASSDLVSSGDEHLRGVKNILKNSFGAVTGAVTATHTELNYTDGVTSAIQTQLNTVSTTANAALPKAGGTVSGNLIMQNNINLGDNNRLYVGNSNDLSIYHSGSHSVIAEAGTGNLLVQAIDLTLGSTTGETHATFVNNGASTLFFDNSAKLATSASGVSVTGTVAATAVTGDGSGLTGVDPFPSGTVMIFRQTSAPSGWTKSTAHNDKALRVVSGTASAGGTHALSSPPSLAHTHSTPSHSHGHSLSAGAHTLSTSQMPGHGHSRSFHYGQGSTVPFPGSTGGTNVGSSNSGNTGGGSSHSHSLSGSISSGGSGTSGSTTPTAFAPQYIDVIVATKD